MSELDQKIEELEAEVLAELEEAAHDAPKKGAVPPEKDDKKNEADDLGDAKDSGKKRLLRLKKFPAIRRRKAKGNQTPCKKSKKSKKVFRMKKFVNFVILKTTTVRQSLSTQSLVKVNQF